MRRTETIEWRPFPRFKPAEDGHYLVDLVKGANIAWAELPAPYMDQRQQR